MEAETLATLKESGTGTAIKFRKKRNERQCKNRQEHHAQRPQRLWRQFSPESEKTGPTPFFADMF
jgi:hypothetical protein